MKQTFTTRLRAAIDASGKSVAEIAEQAGISKQAIHKLLRTGDDPKWSTVCKLADALGVSVEKFRS